MFKSTFALSLFIVLLVALPNLIPSVARACASCGCLLSSDWDHPNSKGILLDLRYDYIDQNQLRSGSSTISPSAASRLPTSTGTQEVESDTTNQYITASVSYAMTPDWTIGFQMPYILRKHSTLGTASDGTTAGTGGGQYTSSTSSLGDAKWLARYKGLDASRSVELIFGLKLPTGPHNLPGTSSDATSPGAVTIDPGLQPGSGTTDVILGAAINRAVSKDWDAFIEGLLQSALNERDNYRPGDGWNLSVGVRDFGFDWIVPQLQINARYVQHDTGASADQVSTGGTLIYLSPGATVPLGSRANVYAFVQAPIYQNLLGVQLAPQITTSVGVQTSF